MLDSRKAETMTDERQNERRPETIEEKLDKLSANIDRRFDAVDRRFDAVDRRLDGVDQRFDSVDQRFDSVDQRFDSVDQRLGSADRRFVSIDQQFDELKAHLGVKIEALDAKLVQVYDAVIAQRHEAERNASDHESFTRRLDTHDVRLHALENRNPSTS